MSHVPPSISRSLETLRARVLQAGERVIEAGWQDLPEALADVDVTRAALELGRPEGWQRARVLLANEGPLHLLTELEGWEEDFQLAVSAAEPAIAAQ
ncbi:MAG: hypothetical protein MRY64_09350 [Hyphomonadaceae bacterium]|nr:hypothetical protein [Hyphomonadaceae bacterium]